jgi:rhamnosyltransferase
MNIFSPSEQNTFVVIITYNPDSRLRESISVVGKIFRNIVIIDNHSFNDVRSLIGNNNLNYIQNEENFGIAKALNIGADFAFKNGAEWILMLDQDSIPRYDILEVFKSVYSQYNLKNRIGQIGVSIPQLSTKKSPFKDVKVLITSGTLLSLRIFNEVGRFREDFFIDSVDFEYSLRIRKKGYVNLLSPEFGIDHQLGNTRVKKIWFLTISSSNHSPIRRYYMARNHAILSIQYFFSFPIWILKKNLAMVQILLQMLIVDDQKILKLRNTCSGFVAGIANIHIGKK